MTDARDMSAQPLQKSKESLAARGTTGGQGPVEKSSWPIVPIRSLAQNQLPRIAAHLLALAPHDRYLRFGYQSQDAQIQKYVDSINFERDDVFGIYNRKLELLAVAHLAYADSSDFASCAEFGVSVLEAARGRGYGARLFDRAATHAINQGVRLMFIHALTENSAMLHIVKKAGATVQRDGTESDAYLELPKRTLDSQLSEWIQEGIGQSDYTFKVQAKQFWGLLKQIQTARLRGDASDGDSPG